MLNFQFTQNIIANFAPQAKNQAATDVVAALADSFAAKAGPDDSGTDFSATLADASAKTQDARRSKTAENNAENAANRDNANAEQTAKPAKPNENKPDARPEKLAAPKPKEQAEKPEGAKTDESGEVSANDNAPAADGKIDAEKIVSDVQEVIDQIDLALASGGEQMSAEMAALLAAMKQLLQQVLQQFNLALTSGAVEGSETVQLDSKAFAPLLKQLDQLVNQLKKANAELAAQLGFGEAGLDTDSENPEIIADSNTSNTNQQKGKSLEAHFASIAIRVTHVSERLQRADAAQNPQAQQDTGLLKAATDAATDATALNADLATIERNLPEIKAANNPVPIVLQPQNLTSQPVQVAAAQTQTISATGGQSSGQFGQSGQGQQQANISQPSSLSNINNQTVAAKDAPNFDHLLKAQVKGSASEQVAFQMKSMVKDGASKMIVKLDPPELGELEIRMQVSKLGKMDVVISVERIQTLELLQKDSRMLQQALSDAGLQADSGSMSFNLKGDNPNSGQRQGNNPYPAKIEENFDEDLLQVVTKTYTTDVQHGVNIHI